MTNRLRNANSPYLLQHADNPVDWHPWDGQALELARREDKPILLSIGYAACHWCHVMAHESFENPAIAALMNRLFVCIKVDREERPDLDRVYQSAHQILTGRPGGWPLTVALTPGGQAPIFAGTYFPPDPRHGMPGFGDLLEKIASHYAEKRDQLPAHEQSFRRALASLNPVGPGQEALSVESAMASALEDLKNQFDPTHGGFGSAPKFPHPTQLALLLHLSTGEGDSADLAGAMLGKTLRLMAQRGLYDHLEGGFFRYSVDREWRIPHFEKMLYDNAQLLELFAEAGAVTGDDGFKQTARGVAGWVLGEMQQDHGGYAATLDADSEGVEGKFYVFSETDLRAVLSEPEYLAVERYFGLYGDPNFEGSWHFNRAEDDLRDDESRVAEAFPELVGSALARLRQVRADRARPGLDDKILTAWNGLMIRAMAVASRRLQNPELAASAERAADFVHAHLVRQGRLHVTFRGGVSSLTGYLDDYAFLAEGLLELLQVRWRQRDFNLLVNCCDVMLTHFEDPELGGFFYTADDHETLLHRPKTGADDAIPSGNASAVRVLNRVGFLLGESRYIDAAARALDLFGAEITRAPSVYAALLLAAGEAARQPPQVVIRGSRQQMEEWWSPFRAEGSGDAAVFCIPDTLSDLHPSLAAKAPVAGRTVAYVCRGYTCGPPVGSAAELASALA